MQKVLKRLKVYGFAAIKLKRIVFSGHDFKNTNGSLEKSSKILFLKNSGHGNSELKSSIKRCDLNNQSSIERYVIQDLMTSALFISMASGILFSLMVTRSILYIL